MPKKKKPNENHNKVTVRITESTTYTYRIPTERLNLKNQTFTQAVKEWFGELEDFERENVAEFKRVKIPEWKVEI